MVVATWFGFLLHAETGGKRHVEIIDALLDEPEWRKTHTRPSPPSALGIQVEVDQRQRCSSSEWRAASMELTMSAGAQNERNRPDQAGGD